MFSWIKKIFKKEKQEPLKLENKVEEPSKLDTTALGKLTKGDLKKLQAEGKIKTIYPPYY
jgi:hypothetical protein